jgi:hypothetical protein
MTAEQMESDWHEIRLRIAEFWATVMGGGEREECLEYPGSLDRKGYGAGQRKGIRSKIHRLVWLEVYGPVPDGLLVLHKCDNPPCAWPTHLFLGTPADNSDDMVAKGRSWRRKRDQTPGVKIRSVDIPALRERHCNGETYVDLAREIGVRPSTVLRACQGRAHRTDGRRRKTQTNRVEAVR